MEKNNQDGPDCLILMNYATHGLLIVNNCLNIVYEVTLLLGLCQVFWQRQPKKKKRSEKLVSTYRVDIPGYPLFDNMYCTTNVIILF